MARINKYAQDATPDKNDKLIGTDSSGGTRNYSLENIGAFLSQTNVLGVHSNIPYKYTHGDLSSGNIKDNNISNLWLSKQYNGYREDHLNSKRKKIKPCNSCTVV